MRELRGEVIEIEAVGALPADVRMLATAAAAEGIRTIDVVLEEWASGENRFTGLGETLLAARVDGHLAAIGGITRDYNFADALRMRRFYVLPGDRKLGIGRLLAERPLVRARSHVAWVTLWSRIAGSRPVLGAAGICAGPARDAHARDAVLAHHGSTWISGQTERARAPFTSWVFRLSSRRLGMIRKLNRSSRPYGV